MTWPVELALPTGRLRVPGPGHYVLVPPAREGAIDALLDAAHAALGEVATGWMPQDGGLLSNLPAWENILLAIQWHAPAATPALDARLQAWMSRFDHDEDAARQLLSRPPARLLEDERRLVGWLRQMLARPRLVLLEGRALPAGTRGSILMELIGEELADCAFIVIDGHAPAGYAPLSFTDEGVPPP